MQNCLQMEHQSIELNHRILLLNLQWAIEHPMFNVYVWVTYLSVHMNGEYILRNRGNHCDLMIAILTCFCTSCRPKITHRQMRHSQRDMFAAIWKAKEVMLKGAFLLCHLPPSLFSSFLVLLLLLMMPNHLVADIGCFQCSSINGSNLA